MCEIAGELECRCRTVGDECGAAPGAHAFGLRPVQDQFGEGNLPVKFPERFREFEICGVCACKPCEIDFVFVDVAKWDDARQNGSIAAKRLEKDIAGKRTSAPRR